jgi:hypothetical protein
MPIRLNLLAEAQAAEEERRRDPVKRSIWVAALILVVMLVWSSSLQLKAIMLNSEVSRLQGQINSHKNEYQLVLDNQTRTGEYKSKLAALERLSTNRFLNGNLLNALQQTVVDDVQLLRVRVDQNYILYEGTKSQTNDDGVLIPGKPASATEKTLLTLEGSDSCANPGDQLNKYKSALATNAYLQQVLVKTNGIGLKNLAPPQVSAFTGKSSVNFTLECRYPEKIR